jgi:hypothetical protein
MNPRAHCPFQVVAKVEALPQHHRARRVCPGRVPVDKPTGPGVPARLARQHQRPPCGPAAPPLWARSPANRSNDPLTVLGW